jgi:hypothetical protein
MPRFCTGAWARFADHLGALTADQQQFYDLAGVLGKGERQTTIVNPQVRRSAVVVKYSVFESDAGVARRPGATGRTI